MIFTACGTNADVVRTAAVIPIREIIFMLQKYFVLGFKKLKRRGKQL
jgi:hypothetical protein